MRTGTIIAMAAAGTIVLVVGIMTGFFGFMMWGLALNGFTGHQQAIDVSMAVYFGLAILSGVVSIILSIAAVYIFAGRREWNAALAAALSAVVFSIVLALLHIGSAIVSAILAGQMI